MIYFSKRLVTILIVDDGARVNTLELFDSKLSLLSMGFKRWKLKVNSSMLFL